METMSMRTAICATIGLLGLGTAQPALASFDQSDAKHMCEHKITQAHHHIELYDERARETGQHSYKVWGKVRLRGEPDQRFSCVVKHREVTSYKLSHDHGDDDDHDFDAGTAAVIGAGVLGLAILGAVAGSSDGDGGDHEEKRERYRNDADADPLSDRAFLLRECRRELRHHLEHDHGRVEQISLEHSFMEGREMQGSGTVDFAQGGNRRFDFECHFDRQGRIHDGDYHYF